MARHSCRSEAGLNLSNGCQKTHMDFALSTYPETIKLPALAGSPLDKSIPFLSCNLLTCPMLADRTPPTPGYRIRSQLYYTVMYIICTRMNSKVSITMSAKMLIKPLVWDRRISRDIYYSLIEYM